MANRGTTMLMGTAFLTVNAKNLGIWADRPSQARTSIAGGRSECAVNMMSKVWKDLNRNKPAPQINRY